MKDIAAIVLPEDLRYTREHVWTRERGAELVAGISDFAQDQLGEIVFIDLPEAGKHFADGEEFGAVESLKSVSALFMPVSGTVIAVNADLEETPTLVNADCYGKGWMIRIRPDNADDVNACLDAKAYRSMVRDH